MKLISDDKKYFKHIRTCIDEIVFLHYKVFKESDIRNDIDLDYCQFSSVVYNLYDESETIEDFISNLLNSITILTSDKIDKGAKVLLRHINDLNRYHKQYRKEHGI